MANYRQIHVSIWKDGWFLDLEPDEKLLFIYLFSNESTSLAGIYKIPLRVIAFETCLDLSFVKATLAKFEAAEKAYYQDGLLWVKNLRKYNKGSETVEIRIAKDMVEIPDCELKRKYIAYYDGNIPYPYPTDTISYVMKCNEEEMKTNGMDTDEDKPAGHPLIVAFSKASGIAEFNMTQQDMDLALSVWERNDLTPEDITAIVEGMKDNDYTISSAKSVTQKAINVHKTKQSRNGKPKEEYHERIPGQVFS